MLPFFMGADGFILSEDDLKRYNGHHQMSKWCMVQGADSPTIDIIPPDTNVGDIKEWLRPTKINAECVERWKATPALRILMIKTQNKFSRDPHGQQPSHRTIPGATEVTPLPEREEHVKVIRDIFRHARLPWSAVGGYVKSHISFLSAPSYELFGDDNVSTGEVSKFACSGTSWSLAWSYFHATRHTAAVLLFREGDGELRRSDLEHELIRLKHHISHPLLLAYCKTQISLVWTFQLLEEMNGETFEIEKSVGLATWDWVLDREIAAYRDPKNDDPDSDESIAKAQKEAIERYNVLSGKLINIRFRLRTFREQIAWVRRMNKTYLASLTTQQIHQPVSIPEPTKPTKAELDPRQRECSELGSMLDRMDDFNKVYLHDADTLADRLSQQMASMSQLVMQRDSRISLATADINNELAWQGKNTNNAMMAIAVASFVFLPGTFIGSVFDTPIFDWPPPNHNNSNNIVAQPFFIFWITSGLTTALLSICWLIYLRRKRAFEKGRRKEAQSEFRRRILKVPTFNKKAARAVVKEEDDNGTASWWFGRWSSRFGARGDEENGLGALKAVSFNKTGDMGARVVAVRDQVGESETRRWGGL